MSPELRIVVLMLHLIAMMFMAAPLYALIAVNERARFTVPPGYNTDRYMENLIKFQPVRCYTYLAVILVTGIMLIWSRGWAWADWALIIKIVVFVALATLLSYVHFGIQPNVERIINKYKAGEEVAAGDKPELVRWRSRRKRLAATCLFLILSSVVMGVRVTMGYAPWLVVVFLVAAAIFAWRAYKTPMRMGWV
ncbi:MAG: hypothetical protein HYX87_03185 [Chloroflexi bacterium]|nr:hypothetical protein [Chloroflexota bacterium]